MIDDPFLYGSTARPPSRREPERDFEHAVLRMLEEHGAREGAILERYRQIAERSSAGRGIRFLVTMILEDEERHHRVFDEMANEIRSFVWEVPVDDSLPPLVAHSDPELLEETKRLLAAEKQDEKDLRRLRKVLRGSQQSSLDPLMVELMLLDTAKHIAILEHIKARLAC